MLHADRRYTGTITGACWMESSKGTPGLSLDIETTDGGFITHVVYFSDKSVKFNRELLEKFGVTAEQIRSGSYMQYELLSYLTGKEVTFQTKAEEYNGKVSIKLAWLAPKTAPTDSRGTGYSVAQMFGGSEEPADTTGANLSDDDIPF